MKRTHTHKGHCQVCGRLQAVNNETGLLADHGYTIPPHWHARNGSCMGAVELPYEKSRDIIPRFIDMLTDSVTHFNKQEKLLRKYPDGEVKSGRMSVSVRKLEGRYTVRTYSYVDAWARQAGKRPELKSEQTPVEYCAAWGAEADAIVQRMYEEGCRQEADSQAYNARRCKEDIVRWNKRYTEWVKDAPLVPNKKGGKQ